MKNHRKKNVATFFLALMLNFGYAQVPAYLNIKVVNFPYLLVAPTTFFKSEKELKVEKIGDMEYSLSYYGKKPKLFLINFREVLITPGDSVELIYNRINSDENNPQDTLIAKGTNSGNYVFSNFIHDRMPKSFYPSYAQDKYQKDMNLLANTLINQHKKYSNLISDNLTRYEVDNELGEFLKRRSEFKIIFDLMYVENKLSNSHSQKPVVARLIDSLLLNTDYHVKDTTYFGYMENTLKSHLNGVITNRFNSIKTEDDYKQLTDYLNRFSNSFVKDYFVYFLVNEYKWATLKYKDKSIEILIGSNPHVGKIKNDILDKENVYD